MKIGRIHSVESTGMVDGPGVRFVVFLQGCELRCAYCHNPDTWNKSDGKEITSEELFKQIQRYRPYFERSGGGVTFSGGEPLLQPEFLTECLKLCRAEGIHTAIDTSGVGLGKYDEILRYTDLCILDVKHPNPQEYKNITARPMDRFEKFVESLRSADCALWVRSVIVPTINDSDEYIDMLWEYVKTLPKVEKVELLPYHLLGVNKYKALNIKYRLENIPKMDSERTEKWQALINERLQKNVKK